MSLSKPVREARAPKPLKRGRDPNRCEAPRCTSGKADGSRYCAPHHDLKRGGKRGKRTSKRRKSRMTLRRECDKRFAVAVKARDGWQCKACGLPYKIQCAHVVSRRYHATRWLMGNAMALCARCHMKYTNDPLGWDLFVEERLGFAGYAKLKWIALAGVKHIDYEAILATLPPIV